MTAGDEKMEKFYQAEQHNCSDFETRCLDRNNSTDEDVAIFVQAGKRDKQHSKYVNLKRKESKHIKHSDNNTRYDRFKVRTKRKKRCCPVPTIAFCFCWCVLVFITFISLVKFTKPGNFPLSTKEHTRKPPDQFLQQKTESPVRPCKDIEVTTVWNSEYKGVMSESSVRLVDVNQDGTEDFIIGFTSDVRRRMDNDTPPCSSVGNATSFSYLCGSGAVALDGKSGKELWVQYTKHGVFAINCNGDITLDGIPDCLLGGRGGVFAAVDGKTGERLWTFKDPAILTDKMNFYTGQFVRDLDNDGVMDVLQAHGGDILAKPFSKSRMSGRLLVVGGKHGNLLRWVDTPDKKETYFSPVVYTLRNGTDLVIFGTGGETHGGGLYVIQLFHLYYGRIDLAVPLYKDKFKGVANPPVLVDLNKDGTVDIVISYFNSTTVAIDGESFNKIWSYSVPNSETYSIPSPGYFNDDDTIDFMIKMNVGPGFPIYYYSIVSIIDGLTGKPITNPLISSVPSYDSPLSLSMEGKGNDLFLFSINDCLYHEGKQDKYSSFVSGSFDTCKLRFKTREIYKLCITNRAKNGACKPILNSDHKHQKKVLDKRTKHHSPSADGNGSKESHPAGKHPGEADFVQRMVGTGALARSLGKKKDVSHESIDLVTATVWVKAFGKGITELEIDCIEKYNKRNGRNSSTLLEQHGIQYDKESPAFKHCIKQRPDGNGIEGYSEEHFAITALRRLRLKCICNKQRKGEQCAKFLPIQEQRWSGYMGTLGNGFYNDIK